MRNRGAGAGRRGGKAERKSPSLDLSRDWLCAAQRRTPYIPVSDGMVMVMVVIIMMMMMIACSTNLRTSETFSGHRGVADRHASANRITRNRAWGMGDDGALESSPFLDLDHPLTPYEAMKLVLLFPLALVRLLLMLVIFTSVWLPCRIYVAFRKPEGTNTDTSRSAVIDWWVKVGSRALLFASGWMFIKVQGRQHIQPPNRTTIFVYNHVCFSDPVLLLALLSGHAGVAKASVADLPFVGAIAQALDYIFVQRRNSVQDRLSKNRLAVNADDTSSPSKDKSSTSQEAVSRRVFCHPDRTLVIAPEGTTKSRNCLLRFRKGAFVPGLPVTPVLLSYPARHFHVGWGLPWNDAFHVYRLLCQVINHVTVEFLEPYVPTSEEQKDPALYAENVRETMARHLGVELVDTDVGEENQLRALGIRPNFRGNKLVRTDVC